MTNQTKNPIFWCLIAVLLGTVLAAIGWDKYESTIAARTRGSIPMMVIGCILLATGLIGWHVIGKSKGK